MDAAHIVFFNGGHSSNVLPVDQIGNKRDIGAIDEDRRILNDAISENLYLALNLSWTSCHQFGWFTPDLQKRLIIADELTTDLA